MNAPIISKETVRKFDFDVDTFNGRERVEGKVADLEQALTDSGYTLTEAEGYRGYFGYMVSRDVLQVGVKVGSIAWNKGDTYGIFMAK